MGKGDRKHRNRRKAKVGAKTTGAKPLQPVEVSTVPANRAQRPTAERMRHGVWAKPQGADKASQPMADVASDAVGRMFHSGAITPAEEQAARHFQSLRQAYMGELPDVVLFKSCLSGSVPGFDDGDGDPDVIRAYRDMERRIGTSARAIVLAVCEEHVIVTGVRLEIFRDAMRRISC